MNKIDKYVTIFKFFNSKMRFLHMCEFLKVLKTNENKIL